MSEQTVQKPVKRTTLQVIIGKYETKEDALYAITQSAYSVYIIAAIQIVFGLFMNMELVFTGAIYLVCGYMLHKKQNKIAGIVFLVLASINTLLGLMNGGVGVVMILVFAMSTVAFRATMAYEKIVKAETQPQV